VAAKVQESEVDKREEVAANERRKNGIGGQYARLSSGFRRPESPSATSELGPSPADVQAAPDSTEHHTWIRCLLSDFGLRMLVQKIQGSLGRRLGLTRFHFHSALAGTNLA
jgi:hypothetical protein